MLMLLQLHKSMWHLENFQVHINKCASFVRQFLSNSYKCPQDHHMADSITPYIEELASCNCACCSCKSSCTSICYCNHKLVSILYIWSSMAVDDKIIGSCKGLWLLMRLHHHVVSIAIVCLMPLVFSDYVYL
jgi:hypothetical protein